MALFEDMFKGYLAIGPAVGIRPVLLGPALIQRVGHFAPDYQGGHQEGLVSYHETLNEIAELASDLPAKARAKLPRSLRDRCDAVPK